MAESVIRVLLVDDDADENLIVGDLLRAACPERFELSWASTYEQGLEAILSARFDVCLIDYRLGQRSGLELLTEVKTSSSPVPMILLTGEGDRGLDQTAAKAGAADYLVKAELNSAILDRSIRYAIEHGIMIEELRKASQLAQSLNLAKSAFLAAMSHEIRTPMNAILGMADLLWETSLDSEQVQYVEVFRRAGAALLVLINDILDLSKIEAGHLELERVEFNLDEVVDQVIELTAVKACAKGLVLLSRLSPELPASLIGDPTRLRQILINLLGNAVKFTPAGEVLLTVQNHPSGKPGHVEFTVTDTGIGIPADKLETIFDYFTQADASTTRKYGGAGLGLGISRRLAEAIGGTLTATSSSGQGSTFRFTAQFDPGPRTALSSPAALADLHGKRVLLIDHNATNLLILSETLNAWGLESDRFRTPAEALPLFCEVMAGTKPFSLVVLNRCMSGMDGFETAAEIRRLAGPIPIVMLTDDPRPGDIVRRVEAGLSGYAVKPVARTKLLRLVCDALKTLESAAAKPSEATAQPIERPERPVKILVAEDSEDNRLLVQVYVKGKPYQLTFEENGQAAVERAAAAEFDLILMDMRMPIMDGLAATKAIRAREREQGTPAVPILALTANAGLQDIERSHKAGCDAHLSKPISKLELLGAIEKYKRVLVAQ